jgi:hypothetical protein
MGEAKIRGRQLAAFLELNPTCIFCGGLTPATSRDHVPSRQVFHRREWPEGYEFPSCEECNQATKDAEQVMALISRTYPDPETEIELLEVEGIYEAVSNNYPDVLIEMMPTPDQTARYQARPWANEMIQTGKAAGALSLNGPLVNACAAAFARKLLSALHYKEFGKIIPREGGIGWGWYSNVDKLDGKLPEDLLGVLKGKALTKRTNRDLSSQFSYTFDSGTDTNLAAYYVTFRFAFAVVGIVAADASWFGPAGEGRILRPL